MTEEKHILKEGTLIKVGGKSMRIKKEVLVEGETVGFNYAGVNI